MRLSLPGRPGLHALIARVSPWLLCLAFTPAVAQEPARELVCEMRYGSETQLLRQAAGRDPYAAAVVEVPERFRLRAVVLGAPDHIEHVTLTAYQLDDSEPPLPLHQVQLDGPFATQRAIPDLTGWQHLYDQPLGREMRFGCALLPSSGQASAPASEVKP